MGPLHRRGRSRRSRKGLAVAVLAASVFCLPLEAIASSPIPGASVVLGFGRPYGSGSVHRGADLAGAAGEHVLAPEAATVSFAGAVPADGGGTVLAVTLALADGTKVSLMPLERALVKGGATVSAGDALGELADHGDASSAQPHLHLSLRRGSVYLDPAPLLVTPAGAPEEPAASGEGVGQSAGAPSAAGVATSHLAPAAGATAAARSGAAAAGQGALAGQGAVASGVTLAPRPGSVPVASAAARPSPAVQPGVVAVGTPAEAGPGLAALPQAPPVRVVHGLDLAALVDRVSHSVTAYAHRHVRSLATGVGALLGCVAALTSFAAISRGPRSVSVVRPEGDAVAAAAGR